MKGKSKLIAGLCTAALLIQSILPAYAFVGKAFPAASGDISTPSTNTQPFIMEEDVSKRELNVKHFRLSDGSYIAAAYPQAVHYEKDGELLDIDNTLEDTSEEGVEAFGNRSNAFSVKYAKNTNGKFQFKFKKGDFALSSSLIRTGRSDVAARVIGLTDVKNDDDPLCRDKVMSAVVYENILAGTDLRYDTTPGGVKESIIVKEKAAAYEYRFELKVKGITLHMLEDGSIAARDASGEEAFTLPKPFMYDAENNVSEDVHYVLSQGKNKNFYDLSIVADSTFINEEGRAFPVTIDPVIVTKLDKNYIQNGQVASLDDSTGTAQYGRMAVGVSSTQGIMRSYLNFTLPSLKKSDVVVGATLGVYQWDGSFYSASMPDMQMNLHELTETLNVNTLKWSTRPDFSDTIVDYTIFPNSYNDASLRTGWRYFDVTQLIQKWYEDPSTQKGVMLKSCREAGDMTVRGAWASFYTTNYPNPDANGFPFVQIAYRNSNGLEPYWTYQEHSAGRAGTGYVNHYTGNLVFVHDDVSTIGSLAPGLVSHVYNGYQAGHHMPLDPQNVSNASDAVALPRSGLGWKLNIQQTIFPIKAGSDLLSEYKYVYSDADGTEHYFYEKDGNVVDEDGLGYEIIKQSSGEYKLTCKDDSYLWFDSGGRLRYIMYPSGKKVEIEYTSFGGYLMISGIKDGAGHRLGITRDPTTSYISYITDEAGRKTTYSYTGSNLTKITYPDGTFTTFTYTSDNMLSTVTDRTGYTVSYSYTTGAARRIATVTEKNGSNVGQTVGIGYPSVAETIVRTSGKDDVYGNADDIITTYHFDNFGRTVEVSDNYGGAAMYSYYNDGQQQNKLKTSGQVREGVYNKLLRGSFEEGIGGWNFARNDGTASLYTAGGYHSAQSIKFTGWNGIVQYPSSAVNKTYTLSAYVKVDDINLAASGRSGVGVWFDVHSASGVKRTVYGEFVTTPTAGKGDDGWVQVSTSITMQADESACSLAAVAGLFNATGTVYIDCVQVEESNLPNRYNFVENGSMDLLFNANALPTQWSELSGTSAGSGVSASVNDETSISRGGPGALKVSGSATSPRGYKTTVKVKGDKGDSFVLSGWAKADAAAQKDGYTNRTFALAAKIAYTDGTTETKTFDFNPYVHDWQFVSGVVVAEKDYTSMEVRALYDYNVNTAYFDGLQLYLDNAQSYTYDDEGNVITAQQNAEQQSEMEYNSSNDLVKLVEPNGFGYIYSYDNKHNLVNATSSGNVDYSFDYDEDGNVTQTVVGSSLLARYTFDGTLEDAMGRQPNATYNGGTPVYVDGTRGQALRLDGVDDWLELGGLEVPSQFTVSLWVSPESTQNGQAFVGKHTSTGSNQFLLGYYDNLLEAEVPNWRTDVPIPGARWQHLTVTVASTDENQIMTVYCEGAKVGESTSTAKVDFNDGLSWCLGQDYDSGPVKSDYLKGRIDDVCFYGRALNEEEVWELYQTYQDVYQGGKGTSLLAGYSFDQTMADAKGRVVDATFHGGTPVYVDGIRGQALRLDGVDDWVELNGLDITPEFTVSMWARPSSTKDGQALVAKHTGDGSNQFLTGYYSGALQYEMPGWGAAGPATSTDWRYVTVSLKNMGGGVYEKTLYIDGVKYGSSSRTLTPNFTGGLNWCLGQEWDGTARSDFFAGDIDEVCFFNRALPAEEIKESYNHYRRALAHFTFDDTLEDTSGNGVNAVWSGGTAEYAAGHSGKALKFDGIDDWVALNGLNLQDSYSVGMWVNPEVESKSQAFLGKHTSAGGNQLLLGMWYGKLMVDYPSTIWEGKVSTGWQHYILTVEKMREDKSNLRLYRDGQLLFDQAVDSVSVEDGKAWCLGQEWDDGSLTDFFQGVMDEVWFYNYALSVEEVQELYETGKVSEPWTKETEQGKIYSSATYTEDGAFLSTSTDSRGKTTSYVYNENKNTLQKQTDAKGNEVRYEYNTGDDITKVFLDSNKNGTAETDEVQIGYTYQNNRLSKILHNGTTYAFGYDAFGNTLTTKVGTRTLMTDTYGTRNGKLTKSTYGNGVYTEQTYDYRDRVTGKKVNGQLLFEWMYDAMGMVGKHIDHANDRTYTYRYDTTGRTSSVSWGEGSYDYNYDQNNNVSKVIRTFGDEVRTEEYIYGKDNLPQAVSLGNGAQEEYEYDNLNRLKRQRVNGKEVELSYLAGGGGPDATTALIETYKASDGTELKYEYDELGNITKIYANEELQYRYEYDALSQLTREDSVPENKSVTYEYDKGGNLLSKKEYVYTTGTLGAATSTTEYSYGDSSWKDLLTSYNGQSITYDGIGNPLSYRDGMTLTWKSGRQLSTLQTRGKAVSYEYDADGIRTRKTVDGVTTTYELDGGSVVKETSGTQEIYYLYGANGLVGLELNGVSYYYVRNGQNDIVGILDASGNKVVSYVYDTWGKLVTMTGSMASTVGVANPYRYRGYRYDEESGLYYLQTRYYDPETGRFLNADGYVTTGQGLLSGNMFAYCLNNPVNMMDPSGEFVGSIAGSMAGPFFAGMGLMTIFYAMSQPSFQAALSGFVDAVDNSLRNNTSKAIASPSVQKQMQDIVKSKVQVKEKAAEKAITATPPKPEAPTYYHITTPENAAAIALSGMMIGSRFEGGYVYAWRNRPGKDAVKNAGARKGVIISFKTGTSFVKDNGITDEKLQGYQPVVSARPGPIAVWDVQIVG